MHAKVLTADETRRIDYQYRAAPRAATKALRIRLAKADGEASIGAWLQTSS
jgi:hypothetical protein